MNQHRLDQADEQRLLGTIDVLAVTDEDDDQWWDDLETFLERLFNDLLANEPVSNRHVHGLADDLRTDWSAANPHAAADHARFEREEGRHYRQAAHREEVRRHVLSVALLVAVEFAVFRATSDSSWLGRLILMVLALAALWVALRLTFVAIDNQIRWCGGSEDVARRDAGINEYAGYSNGQMTLIREGKRGNWRQATVATYDSVPHHESGRSSGSFELVVC